MTRSHTFYHALYAVHVLSSNSDWSRVLFAFHCSEHDWPEWLNWNHLIEIRSYSFNLTHSHLEIQLRKLLFVQSLKAWSCLILGISKRCVFKEVLKKTFKDSTERIFSSGWFSITSHSIKKWFLNSSASSSDFPCELLEARVRELCRKPSTSLWQQSILFLYLLL